MDRSVAGIARCLDQPSSFEEPRISVELWRPRTLVEWLDHVLFGRGCYPKATKALIVADAEELLNRMDGPHAYAEVSERCWSFHPIIDDSRPEGHWWHVKAVIADHLGIKVGASGWKGT